jgi:hypothetical protein
MKQLYWELRTKRFYWYGTDGTIYSAKSTNGSESGLIDGTSIKVVYDHS